MYPKCPETKCTWHLGFGYDNYTYLNGACYHSNGKDNMFCPLNENSPLKKENDKNSIHHQKRTSKQTKKTTQVSCDT